MTDRAVARAVDALRRGWPVRVTDGADALTVAAVETAPPEPGADLLITARRAEALKIGNQRDAATADPVRVAPAPWREPKAVADPATDLSHPLQGPFQAVPLGSAALARAALQLAKTAGLLPAVYILPAFAPEAKVDAAALGAPPHPTAPVLTRARLPVEGIEGSVAVSFGGDAREQLALVIGAPNGQAPLVRLHSECLTGDVLGSLKCDCGPQLRTALARMGAEGWGALLYLRQEGRGIGLANKLRAYGLQDQGFDTVDANWRLGFDDDERDFRVAGAMLRSLGMTEVRLLSNNPRKAEALGRAGVTVASVESLRAGAHPHNVRYLETKRTRSGHRL